MIQNIANVELSDGKKLVFYWRRISLEVHTDTHTHKQTHTHTHTHTHKHTQIYEQLEYLKMKNS